MPQIAQQDYIKIEIADITDLTSAEKKEIKKHIANGTIWDCLISWIESSDDSIVVGRIVGMQPESNTLQVWDAYNQDARTIHCLNN